MVSGPKQLFRELCQSTFQVCKGDAFVYNQALDLMEGRRMGSVHLIGTVNTSRGKHTDRKLALLHDTGLYRRSLGTKHDVLIYIEGILLILCRMVCRNVQFLEVVKVVLHLGAVH